MGVRAAAGAVPGSDFEGYVNFPRLSELRSQISGGHFRRPLHARVSGAEKSWATRPTVCVRQPWAHVRPPGEAPDGHTKIDDIPLLE